MSMCVQETQGQETITHGQKSTDVSMIPTLEREEE